MINKYSVGKNELNTFLSWLEGEQLRTKVKKKSVSHALTAQSPPSEWQKKTEPTVQRRLAGAVFSLFLAVLTEEGLT